MMDKERVRYVQELLTIYYEDHSRKLLDLEPLLSIHGYDAVISFLHDLLREHEKKMRQLLKRTKGSTRLNTAISTVFRIKLSIRTLQNAADLPEAA